MSIIKWVIFALAAFVVAGANSPANAAMIRVDFTAQVDEIFDDANLLGSQFTIGQTGFGYFVYDNQMLDTIADTNWGEYGPTSAFQFVLGGFTFQQNSITPDGSMLVVNNQEYFGDTFYWISHNNISDVPGAVTVADISMELRRFEAANATVFSSDALPESLSIDEFAINNRYFNIEFSSGNQHVINLNVIAVSAHVVPEPGSLTLMVISAGGLFLCRFSSSKKSVV